MSKRVVSEEKIKKLSDEIIDFVENKIDEGQKNGENFLEVEILGALKYAYALVEHSSSKESVAWLAKYMMIINPSDYKEA